MAAGDYLLASDVFRQRESANRVLTGEELASLLKRY